MEGQLAEAYKVEKEFMENKQKLELYNSQMLNSIQSKTILEQSLKILQEPDMEERKVYQPLGKCYLMRDPAKFKADVEFVLEKESKNLTEHRKNKEMYEVKTLDL